MNPHDRSILAAQGYLELGMFQDVWRELNTLPADRLSRADVMEIFVLSLMGERRWDDALTLARQLREKQPEEPGGFIHEAYCLHELGRTQEALDLLLDGPPSLQERAVFFYNAGCYHARLGDFTAALVMLEKSFEMDGNLKKSARRDPDLVDVKNLL